MRFRAGRLCVCFGAYRCITCITDVNGRLKSWQVPESEFTKTQKVTLRRILSHSAGLTVPGFLGYASDAQLPTLIQILNGTPPANSQPVRVEMIPGTKFRYAGGGYVVLQQLLTDVSGKSFPDLLDQLVLKKLGMDHSSFLEPPPQLPYFVCRPRRDRASTGLNHARLLPHPQR